LILDRGTGGKVEDREKEKGTRSSHTGSHKKKKWKRGGKFFNVGQEEERITKRGPNG